MKKVKLKDKPPLSSAQREIMEIVWDKGEVAVFEVTEILNSHRTVARNTIRTLMDRMEDKGWLTHRVIGRTYFYSPLVPREESLGQRVLDMIDKACGGKPENLMMALLDYRGLSDEEVEQIQKLLDDAKKD
jgi:BlaI family penicillinase repressor